MPAKKRENVVRLTVPMDGETHAVFKRMAEAAKIPVGRCIAEWCTDTVDGAQFVAGKMEQARKAPALVMREMQSMAGGLLDSIRDQSRTLATGRRDGPPAGRSGRKG